LSDSSGQQQDLNVFYPFGRTQTTSPQVSFKVSRQFTGQVKDDETGLYYYNARYYDPELGRFVQADTVISDLSNPQTYNRYSYVQNNPLKYTDSTGHYDDLGEIKILANGYVAPGNGVRVSFAGQERLQTLNWAEVAAINLHIAAQRGDAVKAEGFARQIQGLDYNWLIASGQHPLATSKNLLGVGIGLMGSEKTPSSGTKENVVETVAEPINAADPKVLISRQGPSEMTGNNIKRLTKDMKQNGFDPQQPVTVANVNGQLIIIDGHHRTAAAIRAGIQEIPIRTIEPLSPEQQAKLQQQAADAVAERDALKK